MLALAFAIAQMNCAVGALSSVFDSADLDPGEHSNQDSASSRPSGDKGGKKPDGSTPDPEDSPDGSSSGDQDPGQNNSDKPSGVVPIHKVQGTHATSPMVGEQVVVEAVVTADFRAKDELRGFFLQEPDSMADSDPSSSEGILVYCGDCATSLAVRDLVRVSGVVREFHGMTQLDASQRDSIEVLESSLALPTPARLDFPVASNATTLTEVEADVAKYFEAREGMRVAVSTPMTVEDLSGLAPHGVVSLISGARLAYPTDQGTPSADRLLELQRERLLRSLLWDDTSNRPHASTAGTEDRPVFAALHGGFSRDNFLRSGDTIQNLQGVLHWSYAGEQGTNAWRVRSKDVGRATVKRSNPRPVALPSRESGKLRIVAINTGAYFPTVDSAEPVCGPRRSSLCLGADSQFELTRQQEKLTAALCATDADILALTELENRLPASTTALLKAINSSCPGYESIQVPAVAGSSRTCGIIYRPGRVSPRGKVKLLGHSGFLDPRQLGEAKNDPSIAQTFYSSSSAESLTLVVGRFASRAMPCGSDDDDLALGQGYCNATRRRAAELQMDWISGLEGAKHLLVMGSMNAYRFEEPLSSYSQSGFIDLITAQQGRDAYTAVEGGTIGMLDHAFANAALADRVSHALVWHINADESSLLDYNDTNLDSGEQDQERKSAALPLYQADQFRSGSRDPVLVDIEL